MHDGQAMKPIVLQLATHAPALAPDLQVTKKKSDVDQVLDHFAINAENPLTIITQDMARAFLGGRCCAACLQCYAAPLRCLCICSI